MRRHDGLTRDWLAMLGRALDVHEATAGARDADGYDRLEEAAIICGWSFNPDGDVERWARAVLRRPAL